MVAPNSHPSRPGVLALCLAWAVLGLAPAARAQDDVSAQHGTGIELTAATQQSLARLRDLWQQWQLAVEGDDARRPAELINLLAGSARELGFERLPDLATAAGATAIEAARAGRSEVAARCLEAAAGLDAEWPDTHYAVAAVERIEGRSWSGAKAKLAGLAAEARRPTARRLWTANLFTWTIYALLLAGLLYAALQLATKGGGLVRDLSRLGARFLPRPLAIPLAVVLLLWPVALPYGLAWLVLYWSVLLWGYGSASERAVWIGLWLVLGVAPLLAEQGRRWVREELTPQVQAVENLRQGRLYGSLFTDLGVLRSTLPDSAAARHLIADVHRLLGQWDLAKLAYGQVLAGEPDQASVLLNLGAFAYFQGDYAQAAEYFKRAAAGDPTDAAGFFNLSKAYAKMLYLDEATAAREQARAIDDKSYSRWLRVTAHDGIQFSRAGLERSDEIRRQLAAERRSAEGVGSQALIWRHGLSLLLAVGLILVAITLDLARRPFGYSELPIDLRETRSAWERGVHALLPGFDAAELGEGFRAYALILLPAALLLLGLGAAPLYRLPVGLDAGLSSWRWISSLLGLTVFFGWRLLRVFGGSLPGLGAAASAEAK